MSDNSNGSVGRRGFMLGAGAMGASLLSPGAAANTPSASETLGDFESGLDGWTTNGGTDLTRISKEDLPYAVDSGSHALEVDGADDPRPSIRRDIDTIDIDRSEFLVANVYVPRIESSTASVTFDAAFRHDRSFGSGPGNSTGNGGAPVVNLGRIEVPQQYGRRLVWDFSDVTQDRLSAGKRLRLSWHRTGADLKKNPNGRGPGEGYGSSVYISDVALTDDSSFVRSNAYLHHLDQLRGEHGQFEYEYEGYSDGVETGTFVFTDGTAVPVSTRVESSDRIEVTLDGTTYRLGGGWE